MIGCRLCICGRHIALNGSDLASVSLPPTKNLIISINSYPSDGHLGHVIKVASTRFL